MLYYTIYMTCYVYIICGVLCYIYYVLHTVDALSLLYYMAPASGLMLAGGFYVIELPTFAWEMLTREFVAVLVLNGLIAFGLNVSDHVQLCSLFCGAPADAPLVIRLHRA